MMPVEPNKEQRRAVEALAQALYEQEGWQRDTAFIHYKFELSKAGNPTKTD